MFADEQRGTGPQAILPTSEDLGTRLHTTAAWLTGSSAEPRGFRAKLGPELRVASEYALSYTGVGVEYAPSYAQGIRRCFALTGRCSGGRGGACYRVGQG